MTLHIERLFNPDAAFEINDRSEVAQQPPALCVWCLEIDCDLVAPGSGKPCEGADEYAAAIEEIAEARSIHMRGLA